MGENGEEVGEKVVVDVGENGSAPVGAKGDSEEGLGALGVTVLALDVEAESESEAGTVVSRCSYPPSRSCGEVETSLAVRNEASSDDEEFEFEDDGVP